MALVGTGGKGRWVGEDRGCYGMHIYIYQNDCFVVPYKHLSRVGGIVTFHVLATTPYGAGK